MRNCNALLDPAMMATPLRVYKQERDMKVRNLR